MGNKNFIGSVNILAKVTPMSSEKISCSYIVYNWNGDIVKTGDVPNTNGRVLF